MALVPEPAVCLLWLGSTPSGNEKLVALRRRLRELICGPGRHREFIDGMQLATPSVLHAETDHHPTPDTVYVCGGSDASSLTPWACPLDPERFSVTDAMQIIHCRADAGDWLARLSGKTLTCIRCCNNVRSEMRSSKCSARTATMTLTLPVRLR